MPMRKWPSARLIFVGISYNLGYQQKIVPIVIETKSEEAFYLKGKTMEARCPNCGFEAVTDEPIRFTGTFRYGLKPN
jgi:hypothetical protein